jgi:hypothetical protein
VYLSNEEIIKLGVNLKAWAGAMQTAGRGPQAPRFKVNGPRSMVVRKRRQPVGNGHSGPGQSGPATYTGEYPFIGHEEFCLGGITVTSSDSGFGLMAQFTPVGSELMQTVSGMTVPLALAFEHFEGLHTWAMQFASAKPPAAKLTPAQQLETDHANNTSWGAW